jgi:hypothetical protein
MESGFNKKQYTSKQIDWLLISEKYVYITNIREETAW